MSLAELVSRGRARVHEHAPFGARTTYRVGGRVRALVTLASQADLDELGPVLAECSQDIVVLGNGSNLLVADGELDVIGVHLTGDFAGLRWRDDGEVVLVEAGAALDLPAAARRLVSQGIVGFEWAVGVPGTFGGAVAMNAGGHGSDLAASLERALIWRSTQLENRTIEDLGFGYRSSSLEPSEVVASVTLRLSRGDRDRAQETLRSIVQWRREHQPGGANAGSVFRNPRGDHAGRLIELAGAKGLRRGSAVVSHKHANFILVDAGGRANDVYDLMGEVRARVRDHSGVELESEHRLYGFEEKP